MPKPPENSPDTTNELTLDGGADANRRRSPRVPLRVWAENKGFEEFCEWLAAEDIKHDFAFCYRTADLSAEGIFLETTTPLPVGTEMNLNFRVPGSETTIETVGEVVRLVRKGEAGGPPGMAVLFRALDPAARATIDAYVISRP